MTKPNIEWMDQALVDALVGLAMIYEAVTDEPISVDVQRFWKFVSVPMRKVMDKPLPLVVIQQFAAEFGGAAKGETKH